MPEKKYDVSGLTKAQVLQSRDQYGSNQFIFRKQNDLLAALISLIKQPMIVLLAIAAMIYFVSGQTGDALFLLSAVLLIAGISLYQDNRSRHAIEKLKDFTQPRSRVIRDYQAQDIKSEDIVVGDIMIVGEGTLIAADGAILESNDFEVNESVLTGESYPVFKDISKEDPYIFAGTMVAGGLAMARVTQIGNNTRLGKIGISLEQIKEEKTPLENEINRFVRKMAAAGIIVFIIVWILNYSRSLQLLDSLLKALTLAMSILPEEIPVAFTTFMALGAWRLMKLGIVVKQMKTVETLGGATVICTDKTGTLTENKMSLAKLYSIHSKKIISPEEALNQDEVDLIRLAMWASEPNPFDAMEIALHQAYGKLFLDDERPNYKMVHEYPLSGKPPMMTHVFENKEGDRIIAAKGSPEALLQVSTLTTSEKQLIYQTIETIALEGYRILGVGVCNLDGNEFPKEQQSLVFDFKGLVAFYDPPKPNIVKVLHDFYTAGIAVKIITGDNAITTAAIAKQINFRNFEKGMTGDELMRLAEPELKKAVMEVAVFSRMYPEAKLRIIEALKQNNQIVAMTGDGVNDGPALKAAHIGIAMGKKGTEIARQAASLILTEDDLSKMVDAIAMGRKIYSNLKKAIQYIISIHIPIILTVFIPLALGWIYPNVFSPVHVIFLELIMGPTCSIIFENEPIEKNTMNRPPRPLNTTFFNWKELMTSVLQGLIITAGTLWIYQYSVGLSYNEQLTRTMVFTALIVANIFLTLVNRSFYYSIFTTLLYKNNLLLFIIFLTIGITSLLLFVPAFSRFFEFQPLSMAQILICVLTGFISVIWFEVVKIFIRANTKKRMRVA